MAQALTQPVITAVTSLYNDGKTTTIMCLIRRQLRDGKKILLVTLPYDYHLHIDIKTNPFFDCPDVKNNGGELERVKVDNESDFINLVINRDYINQYDCVIVDDLDKIILPKHLFDGQNPNQNNEKNVKYNMLQIKAHLEEFTHTSLNRVMFTTSLHVDDKDTESIFDMVKLMSNCVKHDNFIYVTMNKEYILHWVDFKQKTSNAIDCNKLYEKLN